MKKFVNVGFIIEDNDLQYDVDFHELFESFNEEEEKDVVSFEEGRRRLLEVVDEYEGDIELASSMLGQMEIEVIGRKGTFYYWGVEYDENLIFVCD